jgi:hypothetical protein
MPGPMHQVPQCRTLCANGQAIVKFGGGDHFLGPHGTQASNSSCHSMQAAVYILRTSFYALNKGSSNAPARFKQNLHYSGD